MSIGIVSVPNAFIYDDINSDIVDDEVMMGWALGIIDDVDNYYKVTTHYGYTGYIDKSSLSLLDENQVQDRKSNKVLQMVVTHSFVDLLEHPKVQSKILTTLCKGSFVHYIGEENTYLKVRTDGDLVGFIPAIALSERVDDDNFLYSNSDSSFFVSKSVPFEREESIREALVNFAHSYLGSPYRWGGKSPLGIDCSGMVSMCYMLCGIHIFRNSRINELYPVKEIPLALAKKGDLIYFPGHVAMSIGEGRFIHSTGYCNSFGCVVNSFNSNDSDYREDLAKSVVCAGSVFVR